MSQITGSPNLTTGCMLKKHSKSLSHFYHREKLILLNVFLLLGIMNVSFEKYKTPGIMLYQMGSAGGQVVILIIAIFISSISMLWIIGGVIILCAITYTIFILLGFIRVATSFCIHASNDN